MNALDLLLGWTISGVGLLALVWELRWKTGGPHQPDQGNTPLMAAVYHGQADATRTLLDRGANPDLVNRRGACAQDFLANHEGPRRSELERAFLDHAAHREEPEVQAKRRRM